MAKARVLKGGRVIQVDGFLTDQFLTDLDGFLTEFTVSTGVNSTVYLYRDVRQFKPSDVPNLPASRSGYYKKDSFLSYLAGNIDLEAVKNATLEKDSRVKKANKLDTIVVNRLLIKAPYTEFYKIAEWTYPYNGNPKTVLDEFGGIAIPPNLEPTTRDPGIINAMAALFYNERIKQITLFKIEERDRAAALLTKISLAIGMINENIFPSFKTGSENYETYIDDQNLEWRNGNILKYTLEGLNVFYGGLKDYYDKAYKNQAKIALSSGILKLYWFAMLLSPSGLSILLPQSKELLLSYVCKNELSEVKEKMLEENLVINILLSFNPNNLSQIDDLLAFLITFPLKNSSQTLYELLYLKMSTSTNIKEGLLGLSNWVFNTDFKPTKTKEQFVQVVYALWQLSKYNPYQDNGVIKQDSIGFKVLNPQTANYDNVNFRPQTTFTYSYEVSYKVESQPNPNLPGINDEKYLEVYPEAAPILLPYESEKFAGVFFDNFNFSFERGKIVAKQTFLLSIKAVDGGIGTIGLLRQETQNVLYGTYDIYQPVSLHSSNTQTKSALSTVKGDDIAVNGNHINSLIPIFVLKFIDDAGDRSDAEAVLGYVVDVVTTYTGLGSLTKLKHLRWAATGANTVELFSIQGLRLVVGTVEFTSGALGFFANFVECDPNNNFCNGVKTFIIALQLASLTINATDSLATFAMKRSAAKVIEEVGGTNEVEIVQNIKDRLLALNGGANADAAGEAATAIYKSGYLYSFSASVAATIESAIKKFIANRAKIFKLDKEYTSLVIQRHIELCNDLNIDSRTTKDLVIFSNRVQKGKYVSPPELARRVKYYATVILKREYPGGFLNMGNYKSFCNKLKTTFEENLINIGVDLDEVGEIEYVVKGSAVISWKDGDNVIGILDKPLKQADDIDIGLKLGQRGFNKMVEELLEVVDRLGLKNNEVDILKRRIIRGQEIGKLQYNDIFDSIRVGNKSISRKIIEECQPFTNFVPDPLTGKTKIGFAVLLKGENRFDNFPELPFKF